MKNALRNLGILIGGVSLLTSCEPEELNPGTETLDCNYFTENRVLEDKPDVSIDYLITCDMNVDGDIVVKPGVTIAFATDAGIHVNETGSFKAEGTAQNPIKFTGQDGVKGSWRGVLINSNDPKNVFDHCIIEHAGGIAHNSNGNRGAFVVWSESSLSLTNSTVRLSGLHGLNAVYRNSLIQLGGNTFTANDGAPMLIDYAYVNVPSENDTYSGNGTNRILLYDNGNGIKTNTTWNKVDVDYQVLASVEIIVKEGALFTVDAGLNAFFESGSSITVRDDAAMSAIGTENDRIDFYGATASNGSWGGLYYTFTANALNVLEQVNIEDAGGPGFDGAIYMWASPRLTVRNSYIGNSGSCGFYAGGSASGNPNLTTENVTFAANNGADFCED
ncbi:MAG: hypothetical protein H6602_08350 [Flavobacteriales bacterium]|nr:hypothetical protein [Flavobacteriales bacterium]